MKSKRGDELVVTAHEEKNQAALEPVEKIPAVLKPLANVKSTAEFLQKYIPREQVERLAGAMYGIADMGVWLPEWAKKASCQFWKNYFDKTPLDMLHSAEDFGVMLKMFEVFSNDFTVMPKSLCNWPKLEKFLGKIAHKVFSLCMDKVVTQFSDLEKSQFYAGRAKAEKIIERLNNPEYLKMVKRAKVYLAVAATWRQIESMETNAAREEWLRSFLEWHDAKTSERENKFSTAQLSSRDFYDIFQIIDLPGAAPGRPKKSETRAVEIVET